VAALDHELVDAASVKTIRDPRWHILVSGVCGAEVLFLLSKGGREE
jgi:hypothetical protein